MAVQLRNWHCLSIVMLGLVAGIHLLLLDTAQDVDARPIGVQCTPSFRTAMAGHDGVQYGGDSLLVMAGFVPAIHVLLY
jgi:hypothetical protein